MNKTITLIFSLLATALFAGNALAAHITPSYPPIVNQLVATTRARIRTIDMATFKSAFDKNDLGLIVDVREPEEYADGYIPGAVNVPRGVIELSIWAYVGFPGKTDMSKKITLCCGSGVRCIVAAKSLQDLGFSDITAADMRIDGGSAIYSRQINWRKQCSLIC